MDRDQIIGDLTALGRALDRRGVTGEMYLVGGAAIALAFDERRATRDVEVVFKPKATVYEAAAEVADELEPPRGLVERRREGIPAARPPCQSGARSPGPALPERIPRMLLVLKVLAHRVGEDEDDVPLLAHAIGLATAEQVLEVAAEVFGDRLDAVARFYVEELFA